MSCNGEQLFLTRLLIFQQNFYFWAALNSFQHVILTCANGFINFTAKHWHQRWVRLHLILPNDMFFNLFFVSRLKKVLNEKLQTFPFFPFFQYFCMNIRISFIQHLPTPDRHRINWKKKLPFLSPTIVDCAKNLFLLQQNGFSVHFSVVCEAKRCFVQEQTHRRRFWW